MMKRVYVNSTNNNVVLVAVSVCRAARASRPITCPASKTFFVCAQQRAGYHVECPYPALIQLFCGQYFEWGLLSVMQEGEKALENARAIQYPW